MKILMIGACIWMVGGSGCRNMQPTVKLAVETEIHGTKHAHHEVLASPVKIRVEYVLNPGQPASRQK